MMGIERRIFQGSSGAMLALAGRTNKEKDVAAILSPCFNFGDDPKKSGGSKPPATIGWRPLHFCVVYINLDGSQLLVRHAYYPTNLTEDLQDRDNPFKKADALAALTQMATNGTWPGNPLFPEENFNNFWFGTQQEIYVLIDGKLAEIDAENLIVFSGNKTKPQNPEQPMKNDTFYNAQIISEKVNGKNVMFFQNWFVEDRNGTIKKGPKPWKHDQRPAKIYAMNIHMLLGDSKIPGVIDPDTGNGSGNEP